MCTMCDREIQARSCVCTQCRKPSVSFCKAKTTCDYAEVLAQQTTVGVLAFNVYGGRSDETQRWWKRQIRLTGNALSADEAAISPTAVRLNSYISQRISCSIVKATGQQVQRGQRAAQRDRQPGAPSPRPTRPTPAAAGHYGTGS